VVSLTGLDSDNLSLDYPFFNFLFTGGGSQQSLSGSKISAIYCKMTDFIRVEGADTVTFNNRLSFESIENLKPSTFDVTKSALVSLSNIYSLVSVQQMSVSLCSLLHSPALFVEKSKAVTLSNS